jgi:glucosamine--fructose-6-phosphate aminotransferase (isomerizing)
MNNPGLGELGARLRQAKCVWAVGTGSSFHAAQLAVYCLRASRIPATAVAAFDFATERFPVQSDHDVVVFSHRGTKRYSVAALRRAREEGAFVTAVTGLDSRVEADLVIRTVPQETSATHTISFLAAAALPWVAIGYADASALADAVDRALDHEVVVADAARAIGAARRIAIAGAGPLATIAREGALKIKEAAYLTVEGYPLEEFLHGPLVGLGQSDVLITIEVVEADPDQRSEDIVRVAREAGILVWRIGRDIPLSARSPEAILSAVVPLQLLAVHLAEVVGTNPDSFRRDDERYASALARIDL